MTEVCNHDLEIRKRNGDVIDQQRVCVGQSSGVREDRPLVDHDRQPEPLSASEDPGGQRMKRRGPLIDGTELDPAKSQVADASFDLVDGVVAGRVNRHEPDRPATDSADKLGHLVVGDVDSSSIGLETEHDARLGRTKPVAVGVDRDPINLIRGETLRYATKPIGPWRTHVLAIPIVRVNVDDHGYASLRR